MNLSPLNAAAIDSELMLASLSTQPDPATGTGARRGPDPNRGTSARSGPDPAKGTSIRKEAV